jgi:glycosyltransferase involved in cell wall biosynthesis
MIFSISVIICTHNPRKDYIHRVLFALKQQSLSFDVWELLLVDNASDTVLSKDLDISWHPQARHIREDKLGLTPARLRGIQESQGDLLIFVDDDNVLGNDYLREANSLLEAHPFLGAFGGHIMAETERPVEDWQKPFLAYLAVREITQPIWGNVSFNGQNVPYGAGMCIRREVVHYYAKTIFNDPVRMQLDRKGNSLSSGGDSDLALTAYDCGYATGLFPSLKLKHIIPQYRLSIDYLLRLKREGSFSGYMLGYIRNGDIPKTEGNIFSHLLYKIRTLKLQPLDRKMRFAEESAQKLALKEIKKLQAGK